MSNLKLFNLFFCMGMIDRFYHVHGVHQQRSSFEVLDIEPQEPDSTTPCVVLIIKKGYWQEEDRTLFNVS